MPRRAALVAAADVDQGRRCDVAETVGRGGFAIDLRGLPRQALLEDDRVGRLVVETPLGDRVENPSATTGRLEFDRRVFQGDQAVGQVAPIRPAHDADPVRVGDAFLYRVLAGRRDVR